MNKSNFWGGKRQCAGRKKTCLKKVPFNRRINENILNILKNFAQENNMTQTEALESAILLQSNIATLKGEKEMKIAIPTTNGKLCSHFGHCETFSIADIDLENKKIISIKTVEPEEGISCQSANWLSQQGINAILAGGMGGRPMMVFAQNGVKVISGCPELEIEELVNSYMNESLQTGENACSKGGEHNNCHGHSNGHHCSHH